MQKLERIWRPKKPKTENQPAPDLAFSADSKSDSVSSVNQPNTGQSEKTKVFSDAKTQQAGHLPKSSVQLEEFVPTESPVIKAAFAKTEAAEPKFSAGNTEPKLGPAKSSEIFVTAPVYVQETEKPAEKTPGIQSLPPYTKLDWTKPETKKDSAESGRGFSKILLRKEKIRRKKRRKHAHPTGDLLAGKGIPPLAKIKKTKYKKRKLFKKIKEELAKKTRAKKVELGKAVRRAVAGAVVRSLKNQIEKNFKQIKIKASRIQMNAKNVSQTKGIEKESAKTRSYSAEKTPQKKAENESFFRQEQEEKTAPEPRTKKGSFRDLLEKELNEQLPKTKPKATEETKNITENITRNIRTAETIVPIKKAERGLGAQTADRKQERETKTNNDSRPDFDAASEFSAKKNVNWKTGEMEETGDLKRQILRELQKQKTKSGFNEPYENRPMPPPETKIVYVPQPQAAPATASSEKNTPGQSGPFVWPQAAATAPRAAPNTAEVQSVLKELRGALQKKAEEGNASISSEQLNEFEGRISKLLGERTVSKQNVMEGIAAIDSNRVIEGFTRLSEILERELHKDRIISAEDEQLRLADLITNKKDKKRLVGTEKTLEKKELITDFDKILEIVRQKGQVKLSELTVLLKMDKIAVKEACDILEENNLVRIDFPPIGEPRVVDVNFEKQKNKKTGKEKGTW
ncbi:MAG: hypothetical protein V1777_03025 [Candidatus Micrarchaeota archaeon]